MVKLSLTGIKPTGTPHVGNYLGSIRPALALAETYRSVTFIADWHALTTLRDGKILRPLIHRLAATWLACGLDPNKTVFFQQSRVPELGELNWYLACFTAKGVLNRAHAYKAKVEENRRALPGGKADSPDKEPHSGEDQGVNAGIFTYPVLMAADILLFGADVVPVGQDQKQHVEIARDIAETVNRHLGPIFQVPEPLITPEVRAVPGLDGRKMSKSYDNVIPLFAPPQEVRKAVARIVTDSRRPEEPKDPETCNVFNLFRHFADPERVAERRRQYLAGGVSYGDMKQELAATLESLFSGPRRVYDERLEDTDALDALLERGAERARDLAGDRLRRMRQKLGLR